MKRIFTLMAIFMATATGLSLRAENLPPIHYPTADTIFIQLPNGAGMNLIVKNTAQLKSFKQYQLDSLMVLLSTYVEQVEKMSKTNSDKPAKDVTVTFYPSKDLKDPNAPEQIQITVTAQEMKSQRKETEINNLDDALRVYVEYRSKKKISANSDSVKAVAKKNKAEKRARTQTYLDLGLNNFLKVPANSGDQYDLKPWGSRYIALSQYYAIRVGGTNSPLYLRPGIELAFNNYMFDRNNYLTESNGVTTVVKETTRSFEKSKLATSSINFNFMPELRFREKNGKQGIKIGAGGFVGYRLGSHTKLKYQAEGRTEKDKERSSYNLEDFQYGVNFSVGYRKVELFARYNMNDLFKEDRGPKLNVISFGFRL